MYPLTPFRSADADKMHAVMRAFPLATMISRYGGDGWPTITQMPLVLHADRGARGTLLGHFDGNNPHAAVLRGDDRVTCLFHGPNHYMTPSIYPTEHYPGWNYVTVRVHARARVMTDRERVRALLREHGVPGLFPELSAADTAAIVKDGKIPSYERWAARAKARTADWDGLFTESALQSFAVDQKALDDRIRRSL